MDLTILIQGPLNEISLDGVENYLKYGKVVISHWTQDDIKLLDDIDKTNPNIKIVNQHMPSREEWEPTWAGDITVDSTFPWAVKSTYLGLKNVDTEYVVKTRSDERFENLQPMIDLFLKTKRMVFGNIYAFSFKKDPFKIGDHLFMDYNEKLVKTYEMILESHEFRYPSYCAEHILMINYMRAHYGHMTNVFDHSALHPGSKVQENDSTEQERLLRLAFECIDINLLKDLILCKREGYWDTKTQGDWFPIAEWDKDIIKNTEEFFA
jgi:hypothetical protein